MENIIHWELFKRLEFDHNIKWYMNKPESVLENEMSKVFWDFEISVEHLLALRKLYILLIIEKKKTDLSSRGVYPSNRP